MPPTAQLDLLDGITTPEQLSNGPTLCALGLSFLLKNRIAGASDVTEPTEWDPGIQKFNFVYLGRTYALEIYEDPDAARTTS